MILVSNDPESVLRGSEKIFTTFQEQLQHFGLTEEVSLSMVSDLGYSYASPLVLIYPEAVIYGPIQPGDVPYIVEEHLYKGRVVEETRAPAHELSGKVAWLSARKGTLPAENRVVLKNVGLIDPENIDD
jgi:(2Fe-2S) ferredoxin